MDLQEIKHIYDLFSKYKLTNPVTGHYCPVCLSEDDNIYFQQTPLYQSNPLMLSKYFSSVGIMENNQNDFKYFIPRILEIVYKNDGEGSFFFPQVWDRLAESKYNEWHEDEVEAINDFFSIYLKKYEELNNKELFELTRDILKDVGYENDQTLHNTI